MFLIRRKFRSLSHFISRFFQIQLLPFSIIYSPCRHIKQYFLYLLKPAYPFSFILIERHSTLKEQKTDSYWAHRLKWNWTKVIPQQVQLTLSKHNIVEWWLFSIFFSVLPLILWYLFSDDPLTTPPLTLFCSVVTGFLPLFIWRLCSPYFPLGGVLPTFWGHVPKALQPFIRTIIRTKENVSPVRWATDSEDEILLRYILVSYFNALDKNGDHKIISWRIAINFFLPIVLVVLGIYLQMIIWMHSYNNNDLGSRVFGIVIIVWLIVSYAYSELQLHRIYDQIYVKSGMASQKLPAIIEETLSFHRKDVSQPIIKYGIPGILAAVTTITISLLRVVF